MVKIGEFSQLITKYDTNRVSYYVIYMREAHASDSKWGITGNYAIHQAKTLNDRVEAVKFFVDEWQYIVTQLI